MSDENRRLHPRFDISLAAAITLPDGHEISCNARNLSQGGVGVRLAEALQEGATVAVDVFLVEDGIEDATTPTLSVPATVMWLASWPPSATPTTSSTTRRSSRGNRNGAAPPAWSSSVRVSVCAGEQVVGTLFVGT